MMIRRCVHSDCGKGCVQVRQNYSSVAIVIRGQLVVRNVCERLWDSGIPYLI